MESPSTGNDMDSPSNGLPDTSTGNDKTSQYTVEQSQQQQQPMTYATTTTTTTTTTTKRGLHHHCCRNKHKLPSSFTAVVEEEEERVTLLTQQSEQVSDEVHGTLVEIIFDLLLFLPLPLKVPRVCVKVKLLQALRILLIIGIFVVFQISIQASFSSTFCADRKNIRYLCPILVNRLHERNLTYSSPIDQQIIATGFATSDNTMMSCHVAASEVLDVFNATELAWNALREPQRKEQRYWFFRFRGFTMTDRIMEVVFSTLLVLLLATMLATLNDVNAGSKKGDNVLFPLLLTKEDDDDGVPRPGRWVYTRRKRFVMEASVCIGLFLALCSYLPIAFGTQTYVAIIPPGVGTLVGVIMIGFHIQVQNTHALAASLRECKTAEEYHRWKETLYKPTIGLLHLWSRKLSPMVFMLLLINIFMLLWNAHLFAILFVQLQQQELPPDQQEINIRDYMPTARAYMAQLLIIILLLMALLLIFLGGLAMVSVHYGGLSVLLASLQLPETERFRMDDVQILQEKRGAFLLCGFPLTVSGGLKVFQFVFVSGLIAVVGAAVTEPY